MATFKAIVFQTGRHIKQDGTSNIKIRIYHNRESQYIATSYYIQPGNMDDSGRILPNVTNGEMIEYVGHTVSCISCLIMLSGTLYAGPSLRWLFPVLNASHNISLVPYYLPDKI